MKLIRQQLPDVLSVTGLAAIGWGVAQWSIPGAAVYTGVALLGISYVLAVVRRPQ